MSSTNKIHVSNQYSQFNFIDGNRVPSKVAITNLKKEILLNNKLSVNPILVNNDYGIIDGQHRFLAAKELGVPLYYIVDNNYKINDIITLNKTRRDWEINNYIAYHCSLGKPCYTKLNAIINKYSSYCPYKSYLTAAVKIICKIDDKHLKNGKDIPHIEKFNLFCSLTIPIISEIQKGIDSVSCDLNRNYMFKRPTISTLCYMFNFLDSKKNYSFCLSRLKANLHKIRNSSVVLKILENFESIINSHLNDKNKIDFNPLILTVMANKKKKAA